MTMIEAKLALEDAYVDILHKAQWGLKLSIEDLANHTGLTSEEIQSVKNGTLDLACLEKLAFALNLYAPALADMATGIWTPNPVTPFAGLKQFTTWYGDMTVNAYLVWDPNTGEAATFDTGSNCQPLLDEVRAHNLTVKRIFITHTHPDHLADLARLREATDAFSYGSAVENPLGLLPLSHGDGLVLGSLRIRVLGTSGHTPGGLSYYVEGLSHPLVITGDALFAGSAGGAPLAYAEALNNIRQHLLTLPPNTIVCPGHGPLSTIGEECQHNPFFPEVKCQKA